MQIFSKTEKKIVIGVLLVVAAFSIFNFNLALRRGRDNERQNDLGDIAKALDSYKSKNSAFPASLSELTSAPKDPGTKKGYSYLYISNGKHYQIFASLEGAGDEDQYNPIVVARNLKCGDYVCNFGRASGNTPLDITLEEYENKLKENAK